ncbi:MAG: putative universal stress protein [Chroococcidiopsis sp. SAG 2025]|uniref:universal stress protein n=1 Tax=Chroococcidiopsis sp. SAG 2025 TaxID=171389 RepID=UPI002936D72E|nr:universal stress protein [Chroococcidiopsis sp. SAG 2025]MDV2990755.1 putative universal stress protein [Chroococcidiopsis sp. SAG 2025]
MLKTILVALDGSEIQERVIQSLEELQLQPTTKVVLAHVVPAVELSQEVVSDRPQAVAEGLPYLQVEKQLQSYQAKLSGESIIEIVTGDPAEEIIRLANIYQADLIAIGSRGLTGVKRIIQGSVSSQVVENAPCSVLVVKPAR